MSTYRLSDHFRAVHLTHNEFFVLCLHNTATGVVTIINNITTYCFLWPLLRLAREKIAFGFWPTYFNQASEALLTCLNACEPSSRVIVAISHEDVLQSVTDL